MIDSSTGSSIDPQLFRRALGNFATGVTVITTQNERGEKVGVTANSFNSVSLDPPLILWSIDKSARSHDAFCSANHFAVNILASDQIDLSNHFARQQEDKFAGMDWTEGEGGSPVLANCSGCFHCEFYDSVDAGDHRIILGKVVKIDSLGRPPLCYHQGSYSLVINHPGSVRNDANEIPNIATGRLGEHVFYLMMMAVRVYQAGYFPRQEALGLAPVEARTLIMISEKLGLDAEGLAQHINSPAFEIAEALVSLSARGLVTENGSGYTVTEAGMEKANTFWGLADAHTKATFKDFSEAQFDTFKEVLRGVINKGVL